MDKEIETKPAKDYITNILLVITMMFLIGTIIAIIVVYSI